MNRKIGPTKLDSDHCEIQKEKSQKGEGSNRPLS